MTLAAVFLDVPLTWDFLYRLEVLVPEQALDGMPPGLTGIYCMVMKINLLNFRHTNNGFVYTSCTLVHVVCVRVPCMVIVVLSMFHDKQRSIYAEILGHSLSPSTNQVQKCSWEFQRLSSSLSLSPSPGHSHTMDTCSDTEESPQPSKVNELAKKFEALSGRSRPASCSIHVPRSYY